MNYRHHYHAGNFADVLKHAALLRLAGGLQAKEKGILYLDTHAGRGGYDLSAAAQGGSLGRAPEWPDGVGRLLGRADLPPELADYRSAVLAFDEAARARVGGEPGASPRFYPGSPWLMVGRLRPQDRAVLCERHPEEEAFLASEFAGRRRVSTQAMDGYAAVKAMLPPPERRALVLIDPPFEAQDEWTSIVGAVSDGLARLPGGTFAIWYPLTARARVDVFYRRLLALPKLPPCFTVELLIGGETAGLKLWGCGLLVLNPPWGSAAPLDAMAKWLAPVLAQSAGAKGGVHWLVEES
ncbi:MAG: 23S rRNA (adenine(2030)-N(6))-methyltransferase RlmJ [Opitutaceae bacterium]|nr:23S rRNA (adenine(2030)-N(6))-methyltransferase RlmJ [Opitutaceae bacterium]